MKVTIKIVDLKSLLQQAKLVAPARKARPLLGGVLIETATPKLLTITACDHRTLLEAGRITGVQVDEAGKAVVPADRAYAIVDALPGDDAVIERQGARVSFSAGQSVYWLPCMSVEDFPVRLDVEDDADGDLPPSCLVETGVFLRGIEYVSRACLASDVGFKKMIVVEVRDRDLHMCSTDGYRAHAWTAPIREGALGVCHFPATAVPILRRLVGQLVEIVRTDLVLSVRGQSQVMSFVHDVDPHPLDLAGKLDDLVGTPAHEAWVVGEALEEAVLRMRVLKIDHVWLRFRGKSQDDNAKLQIEGGADDGSGEDDLRGSECVPIEYTGPQVDLAVNPAYLASALAGSDSGRVRVRFAGALDPIEIVCGSCRGIVMPVRQ